MKNKKTWLIILFVLIGILFFTFRSNTDGGEYDSFAKCLTESGAKMYGAFWCPSCKNQKKGFGSSWDYVNYVECAEGQGQTAECLEAGITGYPTWEFADGSRLTGSIPLQQLSSVTGCPLN